MRSNMVDLFKMSLILVLSGILSVGLIGCGDNSTGSDPDPDPDPDPVQINVQSVSTQSHGEVLADGDGNVLYFFTMDVKGETRCVDDCINTWPAFSVEELVLGEGLDEANFNSIDRPDGSSQVTFKGWPLYNYVNDNEPGDTNGDGFNDLWYVAKPANSLMIATEQLVGEDGENYIIENGDYVTGEGNTTYFTDTEGRTLYIFSNDSANTNNFTNSDFSNDDIWAIFYTEIDALPSGMNEDNFGEITVHGERQQLTYKGWPLYNFGQDSEPGDTKGISFPEPGVWSIINADTPAAPENGNETGPPFADVLQIFESNCSGSACHIGQRQSGVRLDSYDNVTESQGIQYGELVVQTGDAAGSPLVDKIEPDPRIGSRMPEGGPYLSQDQINLIRQWIDSGAENN